MRALLDCFTPGATIYLPGATGEVLPLGPALAADPERMRGVQILSCLLPNINAFDYAGLHATASLTTFLLPAPLRNSFSDGRTRVMPIAYSAIARHLTDARIDVAVAHVAPPDDSRQCSLGICADFAALVWRKARRRVAIVNARMPRMHRGPTVGLAEADILVEIDAVPIELFSPSPSSDLVSIAAATAALVPDGATIQFGLGAVPRAACAALVDHRDLRLWSGLVSDEVMSLAQAGALTSACGHLTGIAAGSLPFYEALAASDLVAFGDTETTHDAARLASTAAFHAINSALEVDLFGQANLEWRGGQLVGGCGGASDFARAAATSPLGCSIIALPATARGGVSRIVPRLSTPTVSLSRADIEVVVTEYGVADLRGRSIDARAQALIAIAAPASQNSLEEAWRAQRDAL